MAFLAPKKTIAFDSQPYYFVLNEQKRFKVGEVFEYKESKKTSPQDGFNLAKRIIDLVRISALNSKEIYVQCLAYQPVVSLTHPDLLFSSKAIKITKFIDYKTVQRQFLDELSSHPAYSLKKIFDTIVLTKVKDDEIVEKAYQICYPARNKGTIDYKFLLANLSAEKFALGLYNEYKKDTSARPETRKANYVYILNYTPCEALARRIWADLKKENLATKYLYQIMRECQFESIRNEASAQAK